MKTPVLADWSEYQEAVAAFFRSIGLDAETNVAVNGARSSHDIDVLVKSRHAGFQVTWIVECKLWKSRVTKMHVLALRTIVADVGADRGILLAENGFQCGAAEAAALTNVHLTSLARVRGDANSDVQKMRLSELHDRVEAAHEKYWSIPKSIRIEHGLRPDIFETSFSGDLVIKLLRDLLRNAFRGVYPFESDHMFMCAVPGFPDRINTPEQLIALSCPLISELELRLDRCLKTIKGS